VARTDPRAPSPNWNRPRLGCRLAARRRYVGASQPSPRCAARRLRRRRVGGRRRVRSARGCGARGPARRSSAVIPALTRSCVGASACPPCGPRARRASLHGRTSVHSGQSPLRGKQGPRAPLRPSASAGVTVRGAPAATVRSRDRRCSRIGGQEQVECPFEPCVDPALRPRRRRADPKTERLAGVSGSWPRSELRGP